MPRNISTSLSLSTEEIDQRRPGRIALSDESASPGQAFTERYAHDKRTAEDEAILESWRGYRPSITPNHAKRRS